MLLRNLLFTLSKDESWLLFVNLFQPAGTFSSLKSMMGGGGSSSGSGSGRSGSSNPNDPFSQDEVFKWIHRYVNVDTCECRVDRCTKEQCNHKKTQPRIEAITKQLTGVCVGERCFYMYML